MAVVAAEGEEAAVVLRMSPLLRPVVPAAAADPRALMGPLRGQGRRAQGLGSQWLGRENPRRDLGRLRRRLESRWRGLAIQIASPTLWQH